MRQEEPGVQPQGRPASRQTAQGSRAGELRPPPPREAGPGSLMPRRSSVTARVSLVMTVESGGVVEGAEWGDAGSTASVAPPD